MIPSNLPSDLKPESSEGVGSTSRTVAHLSRERARALRPRWGEHCIGNDHWALILPRSTVMEAGGRV